MSDIHCHIPPEEQEPVPCDNAQRVLENINNAPIEMQMDEVRESAENSSSEVSEMNVDDGEFVENLFNDESAMIDDNGDSSASEENEISDNNYEEVVSISDSNSDAASMADDVEEVISINDSSNDAASLANESDVQSSEGTSDSEGFWVPVNEYVPLEVPINLARGSGQSRQFVGRNTARRSRPWFGRNGSRTPPQPSSSEDDSEPMEVCDHLGHGSGQPTRGISRNTAKRARRSNHHQSNGRHETINLSELELEEFKLTRNPKLFDGFAENLVPNRITNHTIDFGGEIVYSVIWGDQTESRPIESSLMRAHRPDLIIEYYEDIIVSNYYLKYLNGNLPQNPQDD